MTRRFVLFPTVLALALAPGLVACGSGDSDRSTQAGAPAAEEAAESGYERLAEDFENVTTELQIDIVLYDIAGTDGLDIDTTLAEDGTVTLRGEVHDPDTAEAVVASVKDVPGVASVVDHLTVAAPGDRRPGIEQELVDRTLEVRAKLALLEETGADGLQVHVRAHQGTVELRGSVPSEELRTRAVTAVETTDGVQEVVDNLRLE